mmetsp:Transcript_17508/g.36952  ORF Transcript_17508/g.36952 Transcript_17508/m.36952 type:complete len:217 (+) Transcript_17508:109-759(+)
MTTARSEQPASGMAGAAAAAAVSALYGSDFEGDHAQATLRKSRLDPDAIDRVAEQDDLDDESSATNDDEFTNQSQQRKSRKLAFSLAAVAVIGVAIGVTIGINPPMNPFASKPPPGRGPGTHLQVTYAAPRAEEQLRTAQEVVAACSGAENDMTECRRLCRDHICCVEKDEGRYNCRNDVDMDCGVYAACQAMVEDVSVPMELPPETQEKRHVRWG